MVNELGTMEVVSPLRSKQLPNGPFLLLKAHIASQRGWGYPMAVFLRQGFENLSDEALMEHIAAESEDAFAELFERWKRPLISYFHRFLNDYPLSEDLTLEVARKVYAARRRYVPMARFSTWIFQIAHNRLMDEYRRFQRRPKLATTLEDWEYPPELEGDPRQRLEEEEWLREALDSLPETVRAVLLLNLQQGFEPIEIADIIGKTANHVRVLLHHGRHHLREKWREANE